MKLSLPALVLAVLTTTSQAKTDWQYAIKCGSKAPLVNTAIQEFCNLRNPKNNLVVPSQRAAEGVLQGPFRVGIKGECSPHQWVPADWCEYQMHKTCALGDKNGIGKRHYGRNGCQEFYIDILV